MAQGDTRTILLPRAPRFFRRTAHSLRVISEMMQRQNRQLAEEDLSLRTILSSMAEGVLIVDPDGRIRLANEAAARLGEFPNPLDRRISELLPAPTLNQALQKTLADGGRRLLEISHPISEAQSPTRFLEVAISAVKPAQSRVIRGAILVFHDISRLKEIETTRREFVANVSHEFRTPLAVISGYVETLVEGGLEDRELTDKALSTIRKHCDRLNLLIEDLLTISRLEHRDLRLQLTRVEIRDLFQRTLDAQEASIREHRALVKIEIHPQAAWVEADPWRLEQVISNLLQNALRYGSPEGGVPCITLASHPHQEKVEISCRDQGPGIPLADQPHIFERFYRVHKDRSRNAGGTGLGLSIVRNIALAHGGEAHVESQPGHGARFCIRLPQKNPGVPPLARQFYPPMPSPQKAL